jgi:hypothetical protein
MDGAIAESYSFDVGLFHSLLSCRLSGAFVDPGLVSSSGLQVLVSRDEKPFHSVNTFTLTPITLALGLFVSTEVLGWPERPAIHAIFDQLQ